MVAVGSGDSTAYFAHCHYLVFIEDVSGKTGPQRWRPLSSNGKLIDEKALIGHGKKAVKVNMLPQQTLLLLRLTELLCC